MVELLVTILVVIAIVYLVYLLVGAVHIPDPYRTVIFIVVALLVIIWLVERFGLYKF